MLPASRVLRCAKSRASPGAPEAAPAAGGAVLERCCRRAVPPGSLPPRSRRAMIDADRELVSRSIEGDCDAFAGLVAKYNRLGGAIAFGVLGDFDLAEDVVQDAFLRAYRSLERLRDPARFRVWFSGIVRKRAIDVLRQRKVRDAVALPAEPVGLPDGAPSPAELLLIDERREKVLEAIQELPADDRDVVVLKHMEGLSYREISEITNTTVSSVESRLFRARQALKDKLTRRMPKP